MADNIDEIAKSYQGSVLECYSQRLKHELLDSKNIGKIENTDSHASIIGVCSLIYLSEMPLAYRRYVRRYTGLDVEFGIF